jgi:hypothetical protein
MGVKSSIVMTVQGFEGFETASPLLRLLQTIDLEISLGQSVGSTIASTKGCMSSR